MTVAELIAKLQEMPQEMRVICHDSEFDDWDIEAIQVLHGEVKIAPFEYVEPTAAQLRHMSWNYFKDGDWRTGIKA